MTAPARDGRDAPFNDWIRKHPGLDSVREYLSVQNNDLYIHRYSERSESKRITNGQVIDQLAHVEVKAFNAQEPFAQKDTFSVIDDLLRLATTNKGTKRRVARRIPDRRRPSSNRFVRWLGHHVLQMSGDRPDNSTRMVWDGKYIISEDELVQILRFDIDPDHPRRKLDTRRHHLRPIRESHPDLFLKTA